MFLHVLINRVAIPRIKYHNDPSPTPPCSMLFSQGYCFLLGIVYCFFTGGGGGIICYFSTLKDFILEHDKAMPIFQILNIFFSRL